MGVVAVEMVDDVEKAAVRFVVLRGDEVGQQKLPNMAKAKSSQSKAGKKGSGRHRKGRRTWSTYVYRALKQVNKELTVSSKAMAVVNSFVSDIFERIAREAASLSRINKRRTLGSREIQTAVRLLLPAELGKHAMAEGTKAVAKASA